MTTRKVIAEIDEAFENVCRMHYEAVKNEAMKVMLKHPHLEGFCMAMGSAHFYGFKEEHYCEDVPKYMKATFEILDEFDSNLRTTGWPLHIKRYTRGGPLAVIKDW